MVLMLALAGLFCSCTQIEDARRVVAEADSLRTSGMAYDDSLAIAKAAATLSHVRIIYPTDYARANYYYGRLLRNRGDQPAAMLAFLNVIHSRTEDHAIKGRSYCNMGIMCGLAVEHELAYDMYEHSAEEFLKAQDSIAYFYALIDMAFELAEQKRKDESISLTNQIENECTDYYVLTKIWETRADAYIQAEMYDSAIYCVRTLQSRGNQEPTGTLLIAKAFSYMGIYDSAVVYARQVVQHSTSWFDLNNAYYILANEDVSKDKEEALQCTRDRSDIQKLIEIRQGQLSQATQLLEQDLNRKPNLGWLLGMVGTSLAIGVVIIIYIKRKGRKHELISQQTEELLQKNEQLAQHAIQLQSAHSEYEEKVKLDVKLFCQNVLANPDPKQAICWGNHKQMCEIINSNMFGLATKLEDLNLAEHEIEFCVLVLLQLSRKECAEWMHLGESSMGGKKRDTAKKLGQKSANLYDFLLSLACK